MKKILYTLISMLIVACGNKTGKAVSDTDSLAIALLLTSIQRLISASASILSTSL